MLTDLRLALRTLRSRPGLVLAVVLCLGLGIGVNSTVYSMVSAVIASPRLILADEPTGNLHSSQAREIMELFTRLNEAGTTIVQVTHSEENAAYGDRIIDLKDGWIVGERQTGRR